MAGRASMQVRRGAQNTGVVARLAGDAVRATPGAVKDTFANVAQATREAERVERATSGALGKGIRYKGEERVIPDSAIQG
ncbi:MAG: hypothetical protein ACT4TC_06250 [Myxococcaceae bacterium]